MATMFVRSAPQAVSARPLTQRDAIDIWIARWLRVRRSDLIRRYGCDPRRIYEVWGEERFIGSRDMALAEFRQRFPSFLDRIDPGPHKRHSRARSPAQMGLFD